MKVGIYIEDLPEIDCSNPHLGNMGVGGSEFCMLLLVYYLMKIKQVPINVYCTTEAILPFSLKPVIVKDGVEAVLKSIDSGDNFLIMRNPSPKSLTYQFISKAKHKIIIWCHNYILSDYADYLSRCTSVKSVVFVGKQLYDRYIDHDIINKSVYIYNIVPDPVSVVQRKLKKYVVYVGGLYYTKGFHILASIWKDILKKVPDAELIVLGSGNLYSRKVKLGKYSIASEEYERKFIPYLLDKNGKILSSVHFLGIVGQEKYKIFENASVGVVNPSGRTETFGMGVVEMNSASLPVVTINRNGYPDTVKNGVNGYLCNSKKKIRNQIVYLLEHPKENLELGINGKNMTERYAANNILPQWLQLFNEVIQNNSCYFPYRPASTPLSNNFKYLRVIIRFLRFNLHLLFIPPLIKIETIIYNLLSMKFRKRKSE